jgi:hypothetical protein
VTITEEAPRRTVNGVAVFSRKEFGSRRFYYEAGEHVVYAGPTQNSGKTTLCFDLLPYLISPQFPVYVIVSKPRDRASERGAKELGLRRVKDWPAPPVLGPKPSGYLVWPDMSNPDTAVAEAARVARNLLNDRYSAGAKKLSRASRAAGLKSNAQCIIVLDDTVAKSKVLKLDDVMVTHLTMAGAMGIGGWYFVQKPTDAGRAAIWSYSQCEHLFIFYDQVKDNQKRYSEIGGVDAGFIVDTTAQLDRYQCLYIRRNGPQFCIVDSK